MYNDITHLLKQHKITNIHFDSRKVVKDGAFIAIKGHHTDGNQFISKAFENGAKIVITDDNNQISQQHCYLVKDCNEALAQAAEYLYPLKIPHIVAVTGTNGKTSVTHFYMQILSNMGYKAAALGTTGLYYYDGREIIHQELEAGLTTPDILSLHKIAHSLYQRGITHLALEASSHGLDQKRLWNVPIHAAGFTSFSHDHLDYHKTEAEYLKAKMRLFNENAVNKAPCFISSTIAQYSELKQTILNAGKQCEVIGNAKDAEIQISQYQQNINGLSAKINLQNNVSFTLQNSLIGDFQISNILIAYKMAEATITQPIPFNTLNHMTNIPGRMERVSAADAAKHVFVDYSHTPDALQHSLTSLKPLCEGRLLVVFGCGGDRDPSKRAPMGLIAESLADIIIVTDDNPRNENPSIIRQEIIQNSPSFIEKGDRVDAIGYAIDLMKNNDILLIAGKGHETYQIIGEKKLTLDDREIARSKLEDL